MAGLPFQKYIIYHAVSVQIHSQGLFPVKVHHHLPLEDGGLLGVHADVIKSVPPVHILLHRLTVKKHHGHPCRHGLVNNDRGIHAVHRVDAQHIAP